jgi:pilus assembly protein CpaE
MSAHIANKLRVLAGLDRDKMPANATHVGIVEGALAPEQVSGLTTLFRDVEFESIGAVWPERHSADIDILIVGVDAASPDDLMQAVRQLGRDARTIRVLIVLRNADVATTRAIIHAGAADVLPAPFGEAALALCLERLLVREPRQSGTPGKSGKIVAVLKAGGGVGATSIGVQMAHLVSERLGQSSRVCFADLDLQFGAAALYFDIQEALTIIECLALGEQLGETQFASVLPAHKSGVRLLSGPRDLTPLEAVTPTIAESLIGGLRRDFAVTLVDMPSVWTAWTNRVLQLADRIVLVTNLSVAHVHLARRQLDVLRIQKLGDVPLTLVCNAVTAEQQNMLPIKNAERAIGRPFDVVVPSDSAVMGAATNEGLMVSAVRRGTKLEKALGQAADIIVATSQVSTNKLAVN